MVAYRVTGLTKVSVFISWHILQESGKQANFRQEPIPTGIIKWWGEGGDGNRQEVLSKKVAFELTPE